MGHTLFCLLHTFIEQNRMEQNAFIYLHYIQGNLHNYSRMQCKEQKKIYISPVSLWWLLSDPGCLLKHFSFPFFKCPPGGLQYCCAPAYQQRAKMPLMRLQTLALSSNNFLCQFVVVHIAPPRPENNVWRLFRPVNSAGTKIPQQQKLVPAVADQCISEFSLWFSFFLFAFLFKHVSRTSSYCVTPLRWKNTSICVRHLVLGCAGTSQKSRT